LWLVVALALALFIARLLSATYGVFYEGDETSIAAGVAGISNDSVGHLYRYGPQVGYYRLVQGINALIGGAMSTIPVVMVTLSVIAGTLIPLLGLFAFRADLTKVERWLLAGTLAANPILWTSSRYGNTAIVSTALVVLAVVLLSNRPAKRGELLALTLFGCAILVRADAVLAAGAIAALLWRNHGSLPRAVFKVGALGFVLAAIYSLLFVVDPYMVDIFGEVARHLNTADRTRFFELMLWAISPFPLAYAILGLRDLEPSRRWLLAVVVVWCVPNMAFYFASTTTPRYFLLPVFAIALAAAVGMAGVARLAPRRPFIAWAVVLVTATLHLFVGLSNFYPNVRRGWLHDARTVSHDGDVLAGAFLYDSYVAQPIRSAGVFHPLTRIMPGDRSYLVAVRELRDRRHERERILLISASGHGHSIHYFLQDAGPKVIDQPKRWIDPVTYDVGGARLTVSKLFLVEAAGALPMDLKAGDVVWLLSTLRRDIPDTEDRFVKLMPPGLSLGQRARMTDSPLLWTYRVEEVTP
jgi:hypothetical protein